MSVDVLFYMCMFICVCIYAYVYMYICMHICMCVYMCMYVYICIYVYIYIYIVATNFTVVLLYPLVPSVYVLLYFGLLVYHDCMFHSI